MTKSAVKLIFCLTLIFTTPFAFSDSNIFSTALNNNVSVSGQMTTEKFKTLMQEGFKSVIVHRPDQEQGNTTSVHELRTIAEQSKISLIYQPVISGQISSNDVYEFAKYYNSLPKPILLVCKSGTRSTVLFNKATSLGLLNE